MLQSESRSSRGTIPPHPLFQLPKEGVRQGGVAGQYSRATNREVSMQITLLTPPKRPQTLLTPPKAKMAHSVQLSWTIPKIAHERALCMVLMQILSLFTT